MSREAGNLSPLRAAIGVYGAALCAGLCVVSFPASATELKEQHYFSDAAYGAIFLPQVALTIAGSLLGAALARRRDLAFVLRIALCAFAAALIGLAATARLSALAYPVLLGATALVGFGFGLAAAPLNAYPALLFPRRADTALVALHTVIGGGFALGPALIAALAARDQWRSAIVGSALFAGTLLLLVPAASTRAPATVTADAPSRPARAPLRTFVIIAVLYAFAEGTFANWATVYLHEERAVSAPEAALALSIFWGALVIGRLLVSALLLRVPARTLWLALPPLMALSFWLLPQAHDARSGALLFALAGLSCGAFFPLTVSQAVLRTGQSAAFVSSALTAGLMLGVGLGSFAIGPLRAHASLAQIYALSSLYPIAAGLLAARVSASRGRLPAGALESSSF